MAQKVITTLIDDIDGGDASQTVTFALEGVSYEIDLNDKNAQHLRETLGAYLTHGRKVNFTQKQHRRVARSTADVDPKAVRAWAEEQGIEVPKRGRIPGSLIVQFQAAH